MSEAQSRHNRTEARVGVQRLVERIVGDEGHERAAIGQPLLQPADGGVAIATLREGAGEVDRIDVAIAPAGLEWKISSRVFLILNGLSLGLPIPKLTSGAPFAYTQYRLTAGLEIAL